MYYVLSNIIHYRSLASGGPSRVTSRLDRLGRTGNPGYCFLKRHVSKNFHWQGYLDTVCWDEFLDRSLWCWGRSAPASKCFQGDSAVSSYARRLQAMSFNATWYPKHRNLLLEAFR